MNITDKELLYIIDAIAKYLNELYYLDMEYTESYRLGFSLQQKFISEFKDRQLSKNLEKEVLKLKHVGR